MKNLKVILLINSIAVSLLYARTNWIWQNPVPNGNNLEKIRFVNNENGWIVGASGTILHTQDGGEHWQQQFSGTIQNLYDACFIDKYIGWVVGDSVVLFTDDGGYHWEKQYTGDSLQLRSVYFTDKNNG
jgi:photosystem II stability/assembly factor-like uncharacterized protein